MSWKKISSFDMFSNIGIPKSKFYSIEKELAK